MAQGRSEFFCREQPDTLTAVVNDGLAVLRPTITSAWMHAISDNGWASARRADVDTG